MKLYDTIISLKTSLFPMPIGTNGRININPNYNYGEVASLMFNNAYLQFVLPHKGETLSGMNMKTYILGLLKIIFLDEEYKEFEVAGKEIVDIGASIGDTALYFITKGATKVYGFESVDRLVELAQLNISLNKAESKIMVKKAGLSLREIIMHFNVKKGAILKMDCEGCEYEMLKDASQNTLKHFSEIILEYHKGVQYIGKRFKESGFDIDIVKEYTKDVGILHAKMKP